MPIWRRNQREEGEDSPPIIRGDNGQPGSITREDGQPSRPHLPRHLRGLQRLSVAVQVLGNKVDSGNLQLECAGAAKNFEFELNETGVANMEEEGES